MDTEQSDRLRREQGDRLRIARQASGYPTKIAAATAFRWNEQTYYSHESGKRGLSRSAADRYAKAFRVSATWLLLGEGTQTDHVVTGRPLKFDRALVQATFEGLLSALFTGMDEADRSAFVEAALTLLALHQQRTRTERDSDTLRKLVADAANATLPLER